MALIQIGGQTVDTGNKTPAQFLDDLIAAGGLPPSPAGRTPGGGTIPPGQQGIPVSAGPTSVPDGAPTQEQIRGWLLGGVISAAEATVLLSNLGLGPADVQTLITQWQEVPTGPPPTPVAGPTGPVGPGTLPPAPAPAPAPVVGGGPAAPPIPTPTPFVPTTGPTGPVGPGTLPPPPARTRPVTPPPTPITGPTGPVGPGTLPPVPVPVPFKPEDPAVGTNLFTREEAFAAETVEERQARAILGAFGSDLTPLGRRVAGTTFNRFQQLDPLLSFGNLDPDLVEAFSSFRAAPPTQSQLRDIRADIGRRSTDDPDFASFTENFSPSQIFQASLQPTLSGVARRFRPGVGRALSKDFESRRILTPEAFQTPQQLLDLFNEFQGFR